ncbi:Lipopolysaccharide export system ATP-binding protein LptB [Neomoorella glycerini]|uniref:Lipopolysaccharide export system ATP-binding protein LptB n=1 Tax=Neomoorella glycerini TaxID=55779 RepID=A0A6I5ZQG5_9FIRM|nr:ABC transporter ATP-binding protein [Moorella glycerini]QGP91865.1 Lipopolysaccharide export system ATP-binding protein LptB [Moorella glycerini]
MTDAILWTEDLTMAFGGHFAVNGVNVSFKPCSFTSIIGPNGAGKTTFFNLVSGQLVPTRGRIFFKGEDITRFPVHERARRGLGRCFQITNVFPKLTVLENVRLAVQASAGTGFRPLTPVVHFKELQDKALGVLDTVGLRKKAGSLASTLTHGEKRKLEIAIVLAMEPEVMLLDEPTAGISLEEVPAMIELLQHLREKRDRTIILVEHKMNMVLSLSDEVVVLFNGCVLASGAPEQIIRDERVQTAYLGGGMA